MLSVTHQDAAADPSYCPEALQKYFVTPTPVAQHLKHQKHKIVKSPFCTELDTYIVFGFPVKRCWDLLSISKRVCYVVSTAPLYEMQLYCSCQDKAPWCPVDVDMMSLIPHRQVFICHHGLRYVGF